MREEAVVVLRLDTGDLPAKSQQSATSLQKIGTAGQISAGQTAAAMRQLPAQLTDVATQLAGGQNPLLVLLQQGGQVKDSFGGIGPAIKGIGAAINPVTLGLGALGAAVGLLGFAAFKGAQQDAELRKSLLLTGNAAGLTAGRVEALSAKVADSSKQTAGGAREIVAGLAATGQVSAKVLDSMAVAAARVADVSGRDSAQVVSDFSGMAGGVAKWAAEHNKAWNFITVEQYKYIRRLEEQGKAEEAMIYVNEQLTAKLKEQKANLGLLEGAWRSVQNGANEAWRAILGIGREQTTRQQLDVAMARLAALGDNLQPKARAAAEQRVQLLKEQLKLEGQAADAASRNAEANREAIAKEIANQGKAPEFPGAIKSGREQYRADFLRSEKAFYDELEKQRKQAAEDALKDPLGEFLVEKVLPDAKKRDDALLVSQTNFLQSLLDGNDRAGLQLIEDERARGEALIRLDREIAQRRLEEQGFTGPAREEAQRLLDERALAQRRELEQELRKNNERTANEAGRETYNDVKGALSAAFRDASGNPVKAFASALGNAVFQRVSAGLADAMATALVGGNGNGGLLGDLLGVLGGFSGGISVDTGGIGTNNTGGSLPTRGGLATGTNYVPRTMIVKVHEGEAIVPKQFNPAAGGRNGVGGMVQNIYYQVAAGVSPAMVRDAVANNNRQQRAQFMADVVRPGRAFNNAIAVGQG